MKADAPLPEAPAGPLLHASGIVKRFGGLVALNGVDVHQHAGETLGMIGPNGSGKTTFVNCITGHLRPDGGSVQFGAAGITGRRPHQIAATGLVRTYQAVRTFGALTGHENVATALLDAPRAADAERIGELTDFMQLTGRLDSAAGAMTLYEQRRLEILMRLVQQPGLIMLDEPVGGLAASEVRQMIELLGKVKSRCAIFVIEHTMKVIRELADRVVVLVAGEKIADGSPAQVLTNQRVVEQYLGGADA